MQDLHLTLSAGFLTSIIQSISALYLGSKLYQCWRFRYFLKMKGIDKTAIITGGASGLGYETCKLFASNGWRVIALDINAKGLEELQKISPLIVGYVVDISNVESIDELLENLSKDSNILKNGVDTLVNCAGLAVPGPCLGVSWDRMELQFRVNVIGAMYLTRKIIPHLLHKNSGASIVNISSMAGVVAWPWQGAYTPSKFAFGGFTDVLRREVLASGLKLRISSINPGGILTPLSKSVPQQLKQWVESNPSHPFASGAMKSSRSMQQAMAWESLTNALMMVTPQSVAEVIYVACLDPFPRYRYLVATPLMHFLFALLKGYSAAPEASEDSEINESLA